MNQLRVMMNGSIGIVAVVVVLVVEVVTIKLVTIKMASAILVNKMYESDFRSNYLMYWECLGCLFFIVERNIFDMVIHWVYFPVLTTECCFLVFTINNYNL